MHPNDRSELSDSALRYRVVYDALARLSCNINKCSRIEEAICCLDTDVKYIFDSIALRLFLADTDRLNALCIARNAKTNRLFNAVGNIRFDFEQEVAKSHLGIYIDGHDAVTNAAGDYLPKALVAEIEAIWVLPFFLNGSALIATVFSGAVNRFKKTDLPMLKIICESFLAKFKSLQLFEELTRNKQDLQQVLQLLEKQNKQIVQIANNQEMTIKRRTEQLQHKNEQLTRIMKYNAHNIREPLTRILGLVELSKISTNEEITNELIPLLHSSSEDLDKAIRNVITVIEKE